MSSSLVAMLRYTVFAMGLGIAENTQAAVSITFEATDLLDTTPGEDLWQYSYKPSGTFQQFGGFNVLFNPVLYTSLQDPPPPVNGDWTILTVQPDAGLPATGLYTATALTSTPSLVDPFNVSFVYLGTGKPGAQPFEIFDDTFFPPLQSGFTQIAAIPEPETYGMMLAGLALISACGYVRRKGYAA